MFEMSVGQIAQVLGYAYQEKKVVNLSGLSVDSRLTKPGDLFVALVGAKTDGHDYIDQALANGASAVAISDQNKASGLENYIVVTDGERLIQELGGWLRGQLMIPVVAVTGSSGKTTTKDLLAAILEAHGELVATKGNHNNELGLPMTLCNLRQSSDFAVVEMGMRGLGQIDFLCQIARPNYGLITNIGTVHSELLGSQEAIAQAKCELLAYIPLEGAVALNEKDRFFLESRAKSSQGQVIWYSAEPGQGDLWAEEVVSDELGTTYTLVWGEEKKRVAINLQGVHNVENSLGAIAIARTLGVPWAKILQALLVVRLSDMRMNVLANNQGVLVINDAYNANPDSMMAALAVLGAYQGQRRVAVLGDMYELGQYEAWGHEQVGQRAVDLGIEKLVVVGALGKMIGLAALACGQLKADVFFAEDNQAAVDVLEQMLLPHDVVLVKGSRGVKMEEIVEKIMG